MAGEENTVTFAQWSGFISLLLMGAVLWQIRQLLLLLFASVVLANGLNHLSQSFQRRGVKKQLSIPLAVTVLLLALVIVVALIIPPFVEQFQQLLTLVPTSIDDTLQWLRKIARAIDPELTSLLPNWQQITGQIRPILQELAGNGLGLFYSTLGLPLTLLLLIVLSLMFLANPRAYRQGFIRCFPAFYRARVDLILSKSEILLEDWLRLMVVSAVVVTAATWLGLVLLQVRLPLALALVAGIFVVIPNIGPLISLVPAMAIALLDNAWKPLFVLLLYGLINYFEFHWITLYCMGKPQPILRGILLLAQVFFVSVFGLFGLWLAVPLTLVAQVLVEEILIKDILDRCQSSAEVGEAKPMPASPPCPES
ncbi:AI-2E family transporter [Synechocystis salina LEGE 06155]|nr:AI-2E family transporter [Synechocystis salina LEGE 06155]